jgi:hypothetical protein
MFMYLLSSNGMVSFSHQMRQAYRRYAVFFKKAQPQNKYKPKAKAKYDTGRVSERNKTNAHTEAKRQAEWRRRFS